MEPKKLLVGITGFGSTERRESGLENLLWKITMEGDGAMVARFNWNDSQRMIVRWIERAAGTWPGVQVSMIGHSYGCSTLASVIDAMPGIGIDNVFLIDPVWRPYKRLPSFASLWGRGTITISHRAAKIWHWYQTKGWIRGCTVVRSKTSALKAYVELHRTHATLDSHPVIHSATLKEIQSDGRD